MRIKPDFNLNSIYDIKEEELLSRGVKCIFFDLDSTVMQSKTGKFYPETLEFLNRLSKNFKIAIVSNNCKKHYIEKVEEQCDIKIYSNAKKPDTRVLKLACRDFNIDEKEAAMVGDRPLTDILAGKKANMTTILVDSISKDKEGPLTRFARFLERLTIGK